MSIIHDALKKVQQGQNPGSVSSPAPDPIFTDPKPRPDNEPIEQLSSRQNKAKSILALLCAVAFIIGSFIFFFKQLHQYCPDLESSLKSSFFKLIHKKEAIVNQPKPAHLKPLARITVTPPQPQKPVNPAKPANPVQLPVLSDAFKLNSTQTLNIHGVMANGNSHLVLINDQVYQEGDEVDGVKITKITLDYITVINNGMEEKIPVKS